MNDETKQRALVGRLRVGQHAHLDDVVVHPPSPGSAAWLPILESLATDLESAPGRWVVKFPIGFIAQVPSLIESAAASVETLATVEQPTEPPSVVHLSKRAAGSVWEGENHRWQWPYGRRSQSVVSVSRSNLEATCGELFVCELLWEIG